jgi:methionyl aminopeptidase
MKIGRNDPCHCGSGQKYKKCHLAADDLERAAAAKAATESAPVAEEAPAEAAPTTPRPNAVARPATTIGGRAKLPAAPPPPPARRRAV